MRYIKTIIMLLAVAGVFTGCSKIKQVQELTDKISGDKLYFCERYATKEIGEGTKFKTGKVTVMLKLKNKISESSVDINITDLATGKVVDTQPFTVQPGWDYIHFDDVEFKEKRKI